MTVKCDVIIGVNTCNCEHSDSSGLCYQHRRDPHVLRLSDMMKKWKLTPTRWTERATV